MLPVINLGGVALQTRGLVLLLGVWLALWVTERFGRRHGLDGDVIWNFGLLVILAGLAGARLAFALQYLESYSREPLALFSLSLQSMAWAEGVVIGLGAGLLYLRRKQVALAQVADALAPAVALLWAMAGFGALLSGDAYGRLTTMPWGIVLWAGYRHPVQLYEVLAGGAVALVLAWAWPRAPYPGWVALVGAALLGVARLFVEGFRGDPAVLAGGLRVAQLWSLAVALLALWGLYRGQLLAERAAAVAAASESPQVPAPGEQAAWESSALLESAGDEERHAGPSSDQPAGEKRVGIGQAVDAER